ncbi:MAG: tRNA uracil 4-sulfurtransferase ThiI [Patescibacteria group bacterium]
MKEVVLVHYHELALKGKNRGMFERTLVENIAAITGIPRKRIWLLESRIIIEDTGDAAQRLKYVFGISSYAPALCVAPNLAAIQKAAFALAETGGFKRFAVSTSRGDKKFAMTSVEVSREIGGALHEKTGVRVDLTNPEKTFFIEITREHAYVYTGRVPGPGGLPVGTQGNVLALLSGGIDSPVAAHRILKRGASVNFIHFHSYPFTSRASIDKVKTLAGILNRFAMRSTLSLVPFGKIQKEILKKCREPYRVILYRRLMLRIAEKLARQTHAQALVTGESLGQVASQTLENMVVTENTLTLPLFRPLIGFDKEEIIAEARKIGTFETSIEPHDDCCTLFLPKNPIIRARLEDILREEAELDIPTLIAVALSSLEIFKPDASSA